MEEGSDFVKASKHHQCIRNIGQRLRPNDIEKLHFICVGLVPEGRLHDLKGSLLLKEIAEIGRNEYVIEALIRIGRMDLLCQLTGDPEAAKTKYSSLNSTNFDRLRIVLLYIAKNMTDTEGFELLKDIVRHRIDDKRRLQRAQTVLELFDLLMHNVIVNPSRPETVLEVFHIYDAEPWFDKIRSEYVTAADAAADAADAAASAATAAATEETEEQQGPRTEPQQFPFTEDKFISYYGCIVQNLLGDKEKTFYKFNYTVPTDITSSVDRLKSNENINAANVQATRSPTPDTSDKYEAVNTQDKRSPSPVTDSSNSDDNCAETTRQGTTTNVDDKSDDTNSQGDFPSISESDEKSDTDTEGKLSPKTDTSDKYEAVNTQDKRSPSPVTDSYNSDDNCAETTRQGTTTNVDDKSDDTNSQGDFPSISDVDNKSDDMIPKRNHHSTSDFDDKNGEITDQEKRPSTPESDEKSDTDTEGKLSPKTDHDNSSDDATTQGKCSSESDDKSDTHTKGKLSSKIDPDDKNGDIKTQGNLPSTPDPDDKNDDTDAQGKLPSAPVVDFEPEIDNNTPNIGKHLNETKPATHGEYPMKRKPRGCAVIFNIEKFCKDPGDSTSIELENRHGSSKDAEGLKDAFEKLHFIVDRHDDKTIDEILTVTDGYASRDHSSFDCFVFCILTHGTKGKLYDANGHSFQFELIFKKFHADKCPTLCRKPKLFFIQACQGNQHHGGRNQQADAVSLHLRSNTDVREVKPNFLEGNSPNEADFLVFFPARLGLPAFRNDNQGSWFIQSLVENLKQYGESYPLHDIFTMVIGEVSRRLVEDQDGNRYDQTPKFDTSLSKIVFFRPLGAP